MPKGKASLDGATRVAANGYHYTKKGGQWYLTHHLVAQKKLGRALKPEERAIFRDKDKTNFDPDNIVIEIKGKATIAKERARLQARIDELQAQLTDLDEAEKLGLKKV